MDYAASKAGKAAFSASMPAAGYVSEVDALRCLAMTAVVLQHCKLLPFGWTGVWLFFVISGFAITSSLVGSDRMKHSKPRLVRNFYARRCLRIWPVYFLVVGGNMIVTMLLGRSEVLASLPWLATFTYNYRMILYGETWPANGHLWTISVEEQFYLVFPFLFAFLSRQRLIVALWICIALGPVVRMLLTIWFDQIPADNGWRAFALMVFAPAHFDAFSAGALLALLRPFIAERLHLARVFLAAALAAAALYATVYVSINVAEAGYSAGALRNLFSGILWGEGRQIWAYTVVGGLASAIIALILAGEGWLLTVCRLPFLRPIGRVSYGAYIYHLPVMTLHFYLCGSHGESFSLAYSLGKFAFVYPVTLLAAFLSFRFFEEPILKLRTRFS
ncbi:MAG: acyltransferase [Beijerinckiaceae bacterium]|nr:acyltransferase [Beijerinckiaceae bacterium]MCI0598375.1 acyltransferase [Beijerinckiaceae bacterium]MCI0736646.1 acyltransferase [Beijerinckiaceae bacterium]